MKHELILDCKEELIQQLHEELSLGTYFCLRGPNEDSQGESKSDGNMITALIESDSEEKELGEHISRTRHQLGATAFIILYHSRGIEDPCLRYKAVESGANMISYNLAHVAETLKLISSQCQGEVDFSCPVCHLDHCLSQHSLWTHLSLYHER